MIPELYSIRLEANVLGCLIKNPPFLLEFENLISDADFSHKVHRVIFSILKSLVFNGQEVNKVILAEKCKSLSINVFEEISVWDYIDSISFTQLNIGGLKSLIQELVKLRIKRELVETLEKAKEAIIHSGDKPVSEIISDTDSIYNNKINQYVSNDEDPKDLYKELEPFIRHIAANPTQESGLITPYKWFNSYFSGLKEGDGAYFFYARMSEGKSVWMYNLCKGTSLINKVPTLFLDTEMSLNLNMFRAGAMESDVNSFYIQNGSWTRNKELSDKVIKSFDEYKKYHNLIYHKYIPNKKIQEILSIIRRWHGKCVGRGNKAIIVYDYLKIQEASKDRNEWQQLGDHISYLNEIGHDLGIQIVVAGQQNRIGNQNGVRLDDDTTIGGSDRIGQYARFSAIFRRKTPEEIAEHGMAEGTHILKPTKWSRDNGVEDFNSNNLVKIYDTTGKKFRYTANYICYEIKNYKITEKSTLKQIVEKNNLHMALQKDNKEKSVIEI